MIYDEQFPTVEELARQLAGLPGVSDEAADALLELALLVLPSDGVEFAKHLEPILRVVAREVRRVVMEERERQAKSIREVSSC